MAKYLTTINKNFQKHLTEDGISSRKDAGPGVWLSYLLPVAIILGDVKHSTGSLIFRVSTCICCGILAHVTIELYQVHSYIFSKSKKIVIPSAITTALLFFFTNEGIIFSVVYGIFSIVAYNEILTPLMKLYPKSFTYGEGTTVSQALILFVISCFIKHVDTSTDCMAISTVILQVGILCVMSIGAMAHVFNLKSKPLCFYFIFLFNVGFVLLPVLYYLIGENPVSWVWNLISEDTESIQMFIYWAICSVLGVIATIVQLRIQEKASTVIRKIFHVLALLVFIPGIVTKPCLLYLASGVVFGIFITLDMLRVLNMPPLGKSLQAAFNVFADEKDEGPVSLTPLYLLVGCSLPLWIHPNPLKADLLVLFAGLLSVGVGDTVASACGTWVGKNRWPGSKKTKEGSGACFLSQLFLVIALIHFEYVPRNNLIKPTLAIAVTSLVEAKTDQVDNLALPLLMYIFNI